MNCKNGIELSTLPQIVLVLVFIGLVSVVSLNINNAMETTSYDTVSILNESHTTFTNNTYQAFTGCRVATGLIDVHNTSGSIFSNANYTINTGEYGSSIKPYIVQLTTAGYSAGTYSVSYYCNQDNIITLSVRNSTGSIQVITQQLPLLGLIIIMSLVIAILWSSLRIGKSGEM
jgi:hypothetical protein